MGPQRLGAVAGVAVAVTGAADELGVAGGPAAVGAVAGAVVPAAAAAVGAAVQVLVLGLAVAAASIAYLHRKPNVIS